MGSPRGFQESVPRGAPSWGARGRPFAVVNDNMRQLVLKRMTRELNLFKPPLETPTSRVERFSLAVDALKRAYKTAHGHDIPGDDLRESIMNDSERSRALRRDPGSRRSGRGARRRRSFN